MIDRETGLLGSAEIAQEVRAYLRSLGIAEAHPILNPKTLQRRCAAVIASGAVPSQRIRNRPYCEKSVAPQVAVHLGLVVAQPTAAAA